MTIEGATKKKTGTGTPAFEFLFIGYLSTSFNL